MASDTVFFVCLHGSAKSLIAARHFNRLARERDLTVRAESAGLEPDDAPPANVVDGLARDGFDVADYRPAAVAHDRLAAAVRVIAFGCDVDGASDGILLENWSAMPMVTDGYDRARDAIVARVRQLVDELAAPAPIHDLERRPR